MRIPTLPHNGEQVVGRFKRMVNRNENKKSKGHAQHDGQSSGSRNKLWRRPESSYKVQSDEEEQGTQLCEATELVHENKKDNRPSWKHSVKSSIPISTSLHGDNKKGNSKGLGGSLHGAFSGARSTLSSSLHGIRAVSNHNANMNALKAELNNLRNILNSYKDENDELLQDAQILLEENDYLTQELVKLCEENENLQEYKQDLKEQLEEAQFEQEEAQLRLREHMATCYNNHRKNSIEGFKSAHKRGSIMSARFHGANPSSNKSMDRMDSEPRLQFVPRRVSDDGELQKLALSSLQSEMVRKSRAWEEERARMKLQMDRYQDEMEKLRDVAHEAMKYKKQDKYTIKRLKQIMQKCEPCSNKLEKQLEQERAITKDLNEYLARKKQNDSSVKLYSNDSNLSLGSESQQGSKRGGIGRAVQGLLEMKSSNSENRSKSICVAFAESQISHVEKSTRSTSLVLGAVGKRRSSVSITNDSNSVKGLARLRKATTLTSDDSNSGIVEEDVENEPKSLTEYLESQEKVKNQNQSPSGSKSVLWDGGEGSTSSTTLSHVSSELINGADEHHAKEYSTSEWNMARFEKRHSGLLPPLKLSLDEKYQTETMDEYSWVEKGQNNNESVHSTDSSSRSVLSETVAIPMNSLDEQEVANDLSEVDSATPKIKKKAHPKSQEKLLRDLLEKKLKDQNEDESSNSH